MLANSLLLLAGGLLSQTAFAESCGAKYQTAIEFIGPVSGSATSAQTPAAYRVWHHGQTRLLINAGPGSVNSLMNDLVLSNEVDAIILTRLRLEQTADLPLLVSKAREQGRKSAMAIYGPTGSKFMTSTVSLIRNLFDEKRGSYRYLGEVLSPLGNRSYKLQAFDINSNKDMGLVKKEKQIEGVTTVYDKNNLSVKAVNTGNKQLPSIALRIDTEDAGIMILDAPAPDSIALALLAKGSKHLIAHLGQQNHTPDSSSLTASDAGRLAYRSQARQLYISYQHPADNDQRARDMATIKNKFAGLTGFSQSGKCLPLAEKTRIGK